MSTAVENRRDLVERLREHRDRFRLAGVRRLGLFGSFVRDEQGPASDVDVLVEFEPGKKSFDAFMQLAFFLEDVLRRPVELVTTESLSPYLRPRILAEVEDVPLGS